jgi:molybdenum cofactor synthesis domain-containing protein
VSSTAGIVVIGNEVLSAKVEEENARFLIKGLRELGVALMRVVIIRDELATIARDVREMSAAYTHVFTSGGVGSTHDDITFDAIAKAFDVPIEIHPELDQLLKAHYGARYDKSLQRMAALPAGAELLGVEELRYPVIKVRNVFVLPGVPSFLKMKFDYLKPRLVSSPFALRQVFLSVGEDRIAVLLGEVAASHADLEFGSYPRFDIDDHRVKITIESRDADRVATGLAALLARLDPTWVVRVE